MKSSPEMEKARLHGRAFCLGYFYFIGLVRNYVPSIFVEFVLYCYAVRWVLVGLGY